MADFIYPTSISLQPIAQDKMPNLMKDREIFNVLPLEEKDEAIISWEQLDNFTGLQQLRGLNGEPARVQRVGVKRYTVIPGVYGEFLVVDELEMTQRRAYGSLGGPIDITDLVMMCQDQLLGRRLDRIEQIGWNLLSNGSFAVVTYGSALAHQDAYTMQAFSAAVAWSNHTTATPLADIRAVKLLHRGHSVQFNSRAVAYANTVTINNMLINGNAADLYGRRVSGLATPNTLAAVNQIFVDSDLPKFQEYDEGYLDDTGTFQPFIPNGKIIVVGRRPAGQTVGAFRMTRNLVNQGGAPGPYMEVINSREHGKIVPRIEVHDGFNGGPLIYFPSAVVSMNV